MTIATFYEPLWGPREAEDRDLIALWRQSWERQGWETKVFGLKDAEQHCHFPVFKRAVDNKPTVNDRGYERMCFYRHCAFARSGADLFSDFDLVNYSWKPDPNDVRFRFSFVHSFMYKHPALYTASSAGFDWLLDCLCRWDKPELINGQPHISDQTVFKGMPISHSRDCLDYPKGKWENFPVVHYGNEMLNRIEGGSKADKIRALRPIV